MLSRAHAARHVVASAPTHGYGLNDFWSANWCRAEVAHTRSRLFLGRVDVVSATNFVNRDNEKQEEAETSATLL